MGSAISTVVSYVVMVTLNVFAIRGSLPHMDSVARTALPLVVSAVMMGGVSYGVYWLLIQVVSPRLAVLPAILVAIVVYAVSVVFFKGVSYDDVAMLPKGTTLARLLHMKPDHQPALRQEETSQVEEALEDQPEPELERLPQREELPAPRREEPVRRKGKYTPRHMRR